MIKTIRTFVFLLIFCAFSPLISQENHHYQTDFSIENFTERRMNIIESIGDNAIALIQGSGGRAGFSVFRQ